MSDFNATCFASGLPIFEDQPCAAILLVKSPYTELNPDTYPHRRYMPITSVIRGRYDGHGGIHPERDANLEILENYIKSREALVRLRRPEPGEIAEPTVIRDVDSALYFALHHELFIDGPKFYRNGNHPVELAIIHGDILKFVEARYQNAAAKAEKAFGKLVEIRKNASPMSPELFDADQQLRYALFDDGFVSAFLMNLIRENYDPSPLAQLSAMLQAQRLRYMPGAGAGGQDGIDETQLAYYELVAGLAKNIYDGEEIET